MRAILTDPTGPSLLTDYEVDELTAVWREHRGVLDVSWEEWQVIDDAVVRTRFFRRTELHGKASPNFGRVEEGLDAAVLVLARHG